MRFLVSAAFLLTATAASASELQDAMERCRHSADLSARAEGCSFVISRSHERRALLRAFNTRGLALCDLDRCAEAVSDFEQVVRLEPSIAGYFDNLARALRAAGRTEDAIAASERAIRMAPTYSFVFLGKAHTLSDVGRFSDALTVVGQAIAVDQTNAGAWEYRGWLLGKQRRFAEAYASYDKSLSIQPDRPSVFKSRAEIEISEGRAEAAIDDLSKYPASAPDALEVSNMLETVRREQAAKEQATVRPQPEPAPIKAAQAEGAANGSSLSKDEATRLNKKLGEISAQIEALRGSLDEQKRLKASSDGDVSTIDETINLVNREIERREVAFQMGQRSFSAYLTSIRPDDRQSFLTARAASEAFPRVPYYIPGTPETGEFWVEPRVTDTGALSYHFKFVDPRADFESVRETISMSPSEIAETQAALTKVRAWSLKAHAAGLRKAYSKRAACFPQADCPEDGATLEGKASTEVRFNVYEDGSTAGRIQRNKGRFVEGYNVSSDSALLLGAYIAYARRIAEREFSQGTQTKEDLDKMFR